MFFGLKKTPYEKISITWEKDWEKRQRTSTGLTIPEFPGNPNEVTKIKQMFKNDKMSKDEKMTQKILVDKKSH